MTLPTGETAVPAVESTPAAEVTTPTPEVTEGIQREDFARAPFLRKFVKQEPSKPEEKPIIENPEKPEEEPPDTSELGNPDKEEPAGELTPGEPPVAETPTAIKLPDGSEVTTEEIAEWKKSSMLQKDYTQKTQQLAEERRKFEQERGSYNPEQAKQALGLYDAINRDPIGTINNLLEHFAQQGVYEPKDQETLAREDRIRQLDIEIQQREHASKQQTEQEAYNWLTKELDTLSEKHGEAFDRDKVTQFMLDNNVLDPTKAYTLMTHDDNVMTLQQQIDALKKEMDEKLKTAKDEAVNEYIKTKAVKNDTPPPVGAGSVAGAPPVQINRPKSMLDAKKAALARLASG